MTALHLLPHRAARERNGTVYGSGSGSGSASFWRSIQALAALRRYDDAISSITSHLPTATCDEARFQLHFAAFWVGIKRDAGRELAADYAAGDEVGAPSEPLDPDVERAQRGMQETAGGAPLNAKVLACTGLVEEKPSKQLTACEVLLAAHHESKMTKAKVKAKAKSKAKKSKKRGPGWLN